MRPRISPHDRRRIARLGTHAHAFHRFAHHPLCEAYAHEMFVMRGVHLCRGCTLSWLGAVSGLVAGVMLPPAGPRALAGLAFASAASAGIALSSFRLGKYVTRLLPFAVVGLSIGVGVRAGSAAGLALAAGVGATVAGGLLVYRRRGPWRAPCTACAEHGQGVCSGFTRQFRRERAVQRLVGRWLERS